MKNIVDEMIMALSKEEFRDFKYFITRGNSTAEQREDLKILEQIRKGPVDNKSNNATYQVRKRLKKQLEKFAILENLRHDDFLKIYQLVETAKFLFRKNLYSQAWDYLIKAEHLAEKAEEYQLLDQILDIQIAYSYNIAIPAPEGLFMPQVFEKREKNRQLEALDSNTNAAYGQLIYELRRNLSQKLATDIDTLTDKILKAYHIEPNTHQHNLKIYCKLVNMICRILREKKDYDGLKNYAINSYQTLNNQGALEKISVNFLTDLLDTIGVAAIRAKDYANYEKFIGLYAMHAQKLQAQSTEPTYYDFIPFIDVADLYMCTNRLPEAREKLLTVYKKYAGYNDSARIYCLLRMSLMAMNFKHGAYSDCIKYYQELIAYNEKKILNERGFRLEILLFTRLYGVIFYLEDGDDYYAQHLLNQLKRKYAGVLKSPESYRESMFIKILEKILNDPSYLKSKKFISDREQFVSLKDFIPGDWEYISLNAWLETKGTRRSYYECFLEQVSL